MGRNLSGMGNEIWHCLRMGYSRKNGNLNRENDDLQMGSWVRRHGSELIWKAKSCALDTASHHVLNQKACLSSDALSQHRWQIDGTILGISWGNQPKHVVISSPKLNMMLFPDRGTVFLGRLCVSKWAECRALGISAIEAQHGFCIGMGD